MADHATATCPWCNTPGCEADWVDVGVGYVQCGPFLCPNRYCGAMSIGAYDENDVDDEENQKGWYRPGQVGSSVNTFQGKPVSHVTAKALYRVGLLDKK